MAATGSMDGVHPSYHLMRGSAKGACECFRLNMAIFRALAIYAVENVPMNETLTFEQARKVREYNDVVSLLTILLNIDKEKVLHFRASCLHTTNVAQIQKAHVFVQENKISNFNVFLHLAFSEMLIYIPEDEWKTTLKRIRIANRGNSRQSDEHRWLLG
jgi:hypothetical protein